MQTLQQELDPAPDSRAPTLHPVLRELMADPVTAYAEEVRLLRQRVALLEAELAATKAAQVAEAPAPKGATLTSIDDAGGLAAPAALSSEFTESMTPAVVAVDLHQTAATQVPAQTTDEAAILDETARPAETEVPAEPVPNPGFAQAWTADDADASFEERVAERAFFQATHVDEESRSWLLAK